MQIQLPADVLHHLIFPLLTPKELVYFGATCRYLRNQEGKAAELWKKFYLNNPLGICPDHPIDWKAKFIRSELIKRNLRCSNIQTTTFDRANIFGFMFLCGDVLYGVNDNKLYRFQREGQGQVIPIPSEENNSLRINKINKEFCVTFNRGNQERNHLAVWSKSGCVFETKNYFNCFCFFGDLIFYGDKYGNIQVWNYKTNSYIETILQPFGLQRIVGADGHYLIFQQADLDVVIYNRKSCASENLAIEDNENTAKVDIQAIEYKYPVIKINYMPNKVRNSAAYVYYSCESKTELEFFNEFSKWDEVNCYTPNYPIIERREFATGEGTIATLSSADFYLKHNYLCAHVSKGATYELDLYDKSTFQFVHKLSTGEAGCRLSFNNCYFWQIVRNENHFSRSETTTFWNIETKEKYQYNYFAKAEQFFSITQRSNDYIIRIIEKEIQLTSFVEPLPVKGIP